MEDCFGTGPTVPSRGKLIAFSPSLGAGQSAGWCGMSRAAYKEPHREMRTKPSLDVPLQPREVSPKGGLLSSQGGPS